MGEVVKTQPFYSFRDLSQRFASKHLESPFRRWLLKTSLATWDRYYGIEKFEALVKDDIAAGQDGFAHDVWIFKSIFYPEIACTFIIDQLPEAETWVQAAWLTHAALGFREQALNGEIEQEYEAGLPLDMDRYRLFFSRWTNSYVHNGKVRHQLTDSAPSDYIIIAIEGTYYKLKVLEQGLIVPIAQLTANIESLCKKHQDGAGNPSSFGVLTSLCRKDSAELFGKIAPSDMQAMNDAIFLLAIDINAAPTTPEAIIRSVHSDNFANRDYRRSMQLVLSRNGNAGVLVNPHAGLGGSIDAKMCSELTERCKAFSAHPVTPDRDAPTLWEKIPLTLPNDKKTAKTLARIRSEITSRLYPQDKKSTFMIHGIGAKTLRERGWSPDAVCHAAINLAYFRHFGRMPVIGNFINLRSIRHGDIWRYISTTPEMHDFVRHPSLDTLKPAMDRHRRLIKEQKSGDDEFYITTMFLKRLINSGMLRFSSFVTLMLILQALVPQFNRSIFSPDVWLSSIPTYPGVRFAGRASTTLSFLRRGCLGGHYLIFPDHIMTCIVDRPLKGQPSYDTEGFARAIEQALRDILRFPNPEGEGV